MGKWWSSSWGGWCKTDYDDYDDDYSYGGRYKSSLGYSSGRLSSAATSWSSSYSGRSSWGWGDLSGSSTSEEEMEKISELLSKAYKTTRDMVVILDFPFNVYVQFTTERNDSGDSKARRVFVPTTVFEDKTLDDMDKINTFCGLGVHEAAHLKYTSWYALSTYIGNMEHHPERISKNLNSKTIDFLRVLVNVLEDERVEDILLRERPGYVDFIQKSKAWNYRGLSSVSGSGEAQNFLIELIKLIRFPENLNKDVLEKYKSGYEKLQSIIYPLPDNTKEMTERATRLFDAIFDIFQDLSLKKPEKDPKSKGGKSSWLPDITTPAGKSSLENVMSSLGKAMSDKVYEKVLYGSDGDSGHGVDPNKIASPLRREGSMVEKLVTGVAERGSGKGSFIISEKGRKEVYQKCAERVKPYIPAIRRLIQAGDKNYDYVVQGCRSGLLDTTKLAEAYQGVPQVYVRKGEVRTSKTTVCVLVDESGSMGYSDGYPGRHYDTYMEKSTIARDAAILLNEALGSLPGIDLYIYGHSADQTYSGSTELYVYREGKCVKDKYNLSQITGRYENRDGAAIYEAARRVRKHTSGNCIMFVISDGEPCARSYYGASAVKDVHDNVVKVERLGFSVIQVSIDHVRRVSEMFEKYVNLEHDVANFPKTLAKIIKKAILGDKKTTVM